MNVRFPIPHNIAYGVAVTDLDIAIPLAHWFVLVGKLKSKFSSLLNRHYAYRSPWTKWWGLARFLLTVLCLQLFTTSCQNKAEPQSFEQSPQSPIQPISSPELNEPSLGPILGLADLDEYPSRFEQQAALRRILQSADESRVTALLSDSESIAGTHLRQRVQIEILVRLVAIDPHVALSHVATYSGTKHREYLGAVFREWSSRDSEVALEHAKSLAKRERSIALQSIVQSVDDISVDSLRELHDEFDLSHEADKFVDEWMVQVASRDPQGAWRTLLNDDRSDEDQADVFARVALEWIELNGLDAVQEMHDSLEHRLTSMLILGQVFGALATTQPKVALELAERYSDGQDGLIFEFVLTVWARSDPRAAMSAISSISGRSLPRESKQWLRQVVVNTWEREDPHGLLANIGQIPRRFRSETRQDIVRRLSFYAPEEASQLVNIVAGYENRLDLASGLAGLWARSDADSAFEWVMSVRSDYPRFQHLLLAPVFRALARTDPNRALQRALDMPVGSDGYTPEADVVATVAMSQPDLAASMLPQIRDGGERDSAFDAVGIALALGGNPEQALDLGAQLDGSERRRYTTNLFNSWAGQNPQGLYAVLDSLSSPELMRKAAESLKRQHEFQAVLHVEQFERISSILATH